MEKEWLENLFPQALVYFFFFEIEFSWMALQLR